MLTFTSILPCRIVGVSLKPHLLGLCANLVQCSCCSLKQLVRCLLYYFCSTILLYAYFAFLLRLMSSVFWLSRKINTLLLRFKARKETEQYQGLPCTFKPVMHTLNDAHFRHCIVDTKRARKFACPCSDASAAAQLCRDSSLFFYPSMPFFLNTTFAWSPRMVVVSTCCVCVVHARRLDTVSFPFFASSASFDTQEIFFPRLRCP